MKSSTLSPGQVAVLSLDGSLVFVEEVQQTHAAVVALPEQPPTRVDQKGVFTPGKVGAKKISPMTTLDKLVAVEELSDRNRKFLDSFLELRAKNGPHYVDRTPEEQAAFEAQQNPPDKGTLKAQKKAERDAERAQRKADKAAKAGPRYLQRCLKCNQNHAAPWHTEGHDNYHPFEAPPQPVIKCAACGEEESHANHAEGGTHKFIGENMVKGAGRTGRPPKDAEPKAPREPKVRTSKAKIQPDQKHRWVGDDSKLAVLVAINGKYAAGNSGSVVIEMFKAAGEVGLAPIDVAGRPKCPSTLERTELAFIQMIGAGLIAAV